MPTYEYRCPSCGTFDWVQGITEGALSVCPKCSAAGIERQFTPTANIVVKTHKAKGPDASAGNGAMGDFDGMGDDLGGDDFGGDDDLSSDDDPGGMDDLGGDEGGDLGGLGEDKE